MKVLVEVQFESCDERAWDLMDLFARDETSDEKSVRVFASSEGPDWLAAEFSMKTETQRAIVEKLEHAVKFRLWERMEFMISFPKSEAERARARRKAERRRARRKALKAMQDEGK